MEVAIRVLGEVDVTVDGRSARLGGSKQRSVLAMLALRPNTALSSEELIDGLWGERPPASAAKNVQLYISRLRKALAEGGIEAEILTRGHGYELLVGPDAVDAARFERLVELAEREPNGGGPAGAAHAALELWRGAPLADVAEEPFARPEIRRLEELRLRAIELTIDAELDAGRHGEVIARLEGLIAEHPLRESLRAKRMLALYRGGRQSEALEAYRQARETLIEEIGVEPGPELQELQAAILEQDPRLDLPAPTEELPPQLDRGSPLLAGRERELAWLRDRWDEARGGGARLALLSGPAGIGKTRLAAELAREAQGGRAAVLYLGGREVPDEATAALGRARESGRPTLVVLDDADDARPGLLDAAAGLVREPTALPLLLLVLHRDEQAPPAFAGSSVLEGETRLRLEPLGADACTEIARLYAPAGAENMPVATLMAASDGIPLRVHRAASEWAQTEAAERLGDTVAEASGDRDDLRRVEIQVADNVVELQTARERSRLYLADEPLEPTPESLCPFRGLAPFDAAHADFFFGRERVVADLVARMVGSTLLAVVGPSGSGKSSVVRAGLLPALADGVLPGSERWPQALLRPGAHPQAELARVLIPGGTDDRLADGPTDPVEVALEGLAPDQRLVLAVDQFEEVFTACADQTERSGFIAALVRAAGDTDGRVIVVLAVRADFYGGIAEHPDLATLVSSNQVLVGPMRRDELRRAIELPARRAGLRVEPRLVAALIGDVAGRPGGLPLLSTALVELWHRRRGRTIGYDAYAESGGVDGAVARLAETAYELLTEPQRRRARAMLLRLAGSDSEEAGTPVRRRVSLDELETERDPDAATVLSVLTEGRLLTVDEGAVEVAHEALLHEWPRLRDWLEADAEGRRLRHNLIDSAKSWRDSGRDPGELFRGARLGSTLDWAAGHRGELNELEREFLDASREEAEREAERQRRANRRLRLLLAGVGVLLTAAVIAGVIAISERQGAQDAATVADAERLGAEALSEDRLDDALRLANAGAALDDSAVTRSNLFATLLRSPAATGVFNGDGDGFSAVGLSPDGETLAVGDEAGTVILFDTKTREPIAEYEVGGSVWTIAFDRRGESVALTASTGPDLLRGALRILDAETGDVITSASLGRHPADPELPYFPTVAWAPDGQSVIVGYSVGDIDYSAPAALRRFDARTGARLRTVARATQSFSHPLQSSAGGRLFIASEDTSFTVDSETLRVVRRYPVGGFGAAISPDGRTVALVGTDGGLRLLDLKSGRVRSLAGRAGPGSGQGVGAFSPDGRVLSTSEEDGTVVLWNVKLGDEVERLAGHAGAAERQVFNPDGRTLYTAGSDSTVIAWDAAGDRRLGRPFRTGFVYEPPESFPPPFDVSPDGRALAVGRMDGRVDLMDAETLRRTGGFQAFDGWPAIAVEYAPDGSTLAVASGGGGVGLWEAGSGDRVGPLLRTPYGRQASNPHHVQALAFGQGGLLAAGEIAGPVSPEGVPLGGAPVRIWDVESRELVLPPVRVPHFITGLAFNPDASQLAIQFGFGDDEGGDGVDVLAMPSGERLARLDVEGEARSVAFSPDGRLLVAGQGDGSARLWETGDWERVGQPLELRAATALAVAFSPDGRTLATSHDDGAVVLWDVGSQQPIGSPLPGPAGPDTYTTAGFTPDGHRLFVLHEDGTATRWEVDPAVWRAHACAVAGGLTPGQWEEVVPEQDYVDICPPG